MGNARTPFKMGRTKATAYTGDRKRKRQSVQPRTAEKYAFTEGNDKKTVEDKITRLHYEAASCVNGMKDCIDHASEREEQRDQCRPFQRESRNVEARENPFRRASGTI